MVNLKSPVNYTKKTKNINDEFCLICKTKNKPLSTLISTSLKGTMIVSYLCDKCSKINENVTYVEKFVESLIKKIEKI